MLIFLCVCTTPFESSILFAGQSLECFRCDLGFWDLCYTTKTNCSENELCSVGTGKAGKLCRCSVFAVFCWQTSLPLFLCLTLPCFFFSFCPGYKGDGLSSHGGM